MLSDELLKFNLFIKKENLSRVKLMASTPLLTKTLTNFLIRFYLMTNELKNKRI
jgi:hypothetical protein